MGIWDIYGRHGLVLLSLGPAVQLIHEKDGAQIPQLPGFSARLEAPMPRDRDPESDLDVVICSSSLR